MEERKQKYIQASLLLTLSPLLWNSKKLPNKAKQIKNNSHQLLASFSPSEKHWIFLIYKKFGSSYTKYPVLPICSAISLM